jgi:hypothetical protein
MAHVFCASAADVLLALLTAWFVQPTCVTQRPARELSSKRIKTAQNLSGFVLGNHVQADASLSHTATDIQQQQG